MMVSLDMINWVVCWGWLWQFALFKHTKEFVLTAMFDQSNVFARALSCVCVCGGDVHVRTFVLKRMHMYIWVYVLCVLDKFHTFLREKGNKRLLNLCCVTRGCACKPRVAASQQVEVRGNKQNMERMGHVLPAPRHNLTSDELAISCSGTHHHHHHRYLPTNLSTTHESAYH